MKNKDTICSAEENNVKEQITEIQNTINHKRQMAKLEEKRYNLLAKSENVQSFQQRLDQTSQYPEPGRRDN